MCLTILLLLVAFTLVSTPIVAFFMVELTQIPRPVVIANVLVDAYLLWRDLRWSRESLRKRLQRTFD